MNYELTLTAVTQEVFCFQAMLPRIPQTSKYQNYYP